MPDSDWSETSPDLPHINDAELHKFRAAIFKEVALVLEKEIGSLKSTLKTEMETHVIKQIKKVKYWLYFSVNNRTQHAHISGFV